MGVLAYAIIPTQRKSNTSIGEIYFWTATIHKWMCLLENDFNKQLVVAYLKKLSGSIKVARHKLECIHQKQVNKKWQLAKNNFSYHYSSARFYEIGIDDVGFLKHIFTVMYGD